MKKIKVLIFGLFAALSFCVLSVNVGAKKPDGYVAPIISESPAIYIPPAELVYNNSQSSVSSGDNVTICRDYKVWNSANVDNNTDASRLAYDETNPQFRFYTGKPTCEEEKCKNRVVFCLDPHIVGPNVAEDSAIDYTLSDPSKDGIGLDTDFGKAIYELYYRYRQENSCNMDTDYTCLAKYQTAARYIEFRLYEWTGNPLNKGAAESWANINKWESYATDGSGLVGSVVDAARILAEEAINYRENHVALGQPISIDKPTDSGIEVIDSRFSIDYTIVVKNVTTSVQNLVLDPNLIVLKDGNGNVIDKSTLGIQYKISEKEDGVDTTRTFTLNVTGNVPTTSDCNYTLNLPVNYDNPNDVTGVFIISPSGGERYQQLLVFTSCSSRTLDISFGLGFPNNVCNNYCTDEDGNNHYCGGLDRETCEKQYCNNCTTSGSLDCASDPKSVVVNEGVNKLSYEADNNQSNTDWGKCVIGKADEQKNEYDVLKDNVTNGQTASANDDNVFYLTGKTGLVQSWYNTSDYCTISCKEEYAFNLPGNKEEGVKQGYFFTFDVNNSVPTHTIAQIKSNRKCVTSGIDFNGNVTNTISADIFEKRINDLRSQYTDAINAKNYYQAVVDKLNEKYSSYESSNVQSPYTFGDTSSPHSNCDGPIASAISSVESGARANDEWTASGPDDANYSHVADHFFTPTSGKSTTGIYTGPSFATARIHRENTPDKYSVYPEFYGAINDGVSVAEDSDTSSASWSCSWTYTYSCGTKEKPQTCTGTASASGTVYRKHGDGDRMSNYKGQIAEAQANKAAAERLAEALKAQIIYQMQQFNRCSVGLLDEFNRYQFEPEITFNYEETYIKDIDNGKLVLEEDFVDSKKVVDNLYLCKSAPSIGDTDKIFEDCKLITNEGDKEEFKESFVMPESDTLTYYEAIRAGVKSRGMCDAGPDIVGTEACTREELLEGSCSANSDGTYTRKNELCNYTTSKAFYTYPPLGDVTTNPNVPNDRGDNLATIIDTDGHVFPVAITTEAGFKEYTISFKNIGQYNGTDNLGRIMGGNGSKEGTREGDLKDQEKCNYRVCQIDDPDCGKEACQSVILINSDGITESSTNPGYNVLNFIARSVSLNNLFPNAGVKGINWSNSDKVTTRDAAGNELSSVQDVMDAIQANGESIYGGEPDYKVTLDSKCIQNIKEYNKTHNFNDYTSTVNNNENGYIPGSNITSIDFFEKMESWGCPITGTKVKANEMDAIG